MGDQILNLRFFEFCRVGDIKGVQAAIDNGANVNSVQCTERCTERCTDMFLTLGWTCTEHSNPLGLTGLMLALSNKHNNVVQLLLNHPQIDVNIVNRAYGYCALHYAVNGHNHKGMAALLARQDLTTINQRSNHGRTPIMRALTGPTRVNCFNLLLAHPEVDLDTRDKYQRSPEEVRRYLNLNTYHIFQIIH